MKITQYIDNKIERLPKGYVFTYEDFVTEVNNKEAVIKALNRMTASGKIEKLAKGKFYKAEDTTFGTLKPKQEQIVKDFLEKDGRLIGYITGYGIYNQLGLTTQISSVIQIGKNTLRPSTTRGRYKVSFILQKNTITKDNIPLLQLLDSIKYIKKIPDSSTDQSCKRLISLVKVLSESELLTMVRLSLKYPPSTRALLGAILDSVDPNLTTDNLKESLNPITTYKLSVSQKILPTAPNWNIQ